ncbi:hypothetical protein [Amycolatopsis thermoflava]|uniref:hypothetical protein n=1 Tax=Amycolatopsis thermoflava TaxID=84480 RepID=UPI00365D8EDE
MWAWVIGGMAAFVVTVCAAAAYVALFVGDAPRREMAYRVLKLVLGAGTGTGGVLMITMKLYEIGVL